MPFPAMAPVPPAAKRAGLRAGLASGRLLRMPGAFSPLVARLIEELGFDGAYVSGAVVAADLGLPDVGLTTMTEVAQRARQIASATSLPVLADTDTGFGEPLNAARTVAELDDLGLAGCHLEDQVNPKRCGHLEGKRLISAREMVGKIEAAVQARSDPDFTIIARTDAKESLGLEEAIRRSREYLAAGADCIFLEAMHSRDEMRRVRDELDAPLLANMVEGGKTPWLTAKELEAIGYNLVIYPLSGWMAATAVLRKLFAELYETGTTQGFWDAQGLRMSFAELFEVFDYSNISDLERRFVRDRD